MAPFEAGLGAFGLGKLDAFCERCMLQTLENPAVSIHGFWFVECYLHLCKQVGHSLHSYRHRTV